MTWSASRPWITTVARVVLAGVLGAWIVLRRLAFFTHSVGTATFPGLVVASAWGIAPQLAALGAALGRIVSDAELRARVGREARASVLPRFGVDKYVDSIVNLYDELLGKAA